MSGNREYIIKMLKYIRSEAQKASFPFTVYLLDIAIADLSKKQNRSKSDIQLDTSTEFMKQIDP